MDNATTYSSAIAYNNQGALHLQHGRFLNAAKSFHSALDTIKAAMDEPANDNDDATTSTVSFEWSEDPNPHLKLPQEESEESFVYRRALVIHSSQTAPPQSEDGFVEESTAILYNLALAYHLYGLQSRSRYLHTALRFYELAFGLRHSQSTVVNIHVLFDLALLNNLGQIHHEIFNFDKSLQCFVHLSEELQSQQELMDRQDYMGFLQNLTLQAPSAAPSA